MATVMQSLSCYVMKKTLPCEFKDGRSLKIKTLYIHLYFIVTQYYENENMPLWKI